MRLSRLLSEALGLQLGSGPDPQVSSVVQDHRQARPGSLFVARAGARFDGRRLISEAAALGAVAVLAEDSPLLQDSPLPVVLVPDAEAVVGPLAALLAGSPADRLRVAGVTGTDGKTTTSYLLQWLLSARYRTALLSTAGSNDGTRAVRFEGHFTTPEAPEVQALLSSAVAAGSSHAVLEASSHALDRHRLAGVSFDLALWTNLTPEHLDWHGTMDNYLLAKRSLVERAGRAVLNADDPWFASMASAAAEVISYGLSDDADWRARDIRQTPHGISFELVHPGGQQRIELPLLGDYNVYNALAALAAAASMGVSVPQAAARLAGFGGVPGRMQFVAQEPFPVLVDFAHTGPALSKALAAVRTVTDGRIILVVGAAGERDHGKRRPLAEAASAGADLIVFTEEDSRSEDTAGILEQLQQAALTAGATPERLRLEPDRRRAISVALSLARPGDLVLLAGKGVETALERSSGDIPWDEAAVAAELLRGLSDL